MSKNRQVFDTIVSGDSNILTFDYTSKLAVGETISTQSVTSVVYSGTDGNANTMISGSPVVNGAIVTQLINTYPTSSGGVAGAIYTITCNVTTSLGQRLQLGGYVTVVPVVP